MRDRSIGIDLCWALFQGVLCCWCFCFCRCHCGSLSRMPPQLLWSWSAFQIWLHPALFWWIRRGLWWTAIFCSPYPSSPFCSAEAFPELTRQVLNTFPFISLGSFELLGERLNFFPQAMDVPFSSAWLVCRLDVKFHLLSSKMLPLPGCRLLLWENCLSAQLSLLVWLLAFCWDPGLVGNNVCCQY